MSIFSVTLFDHSFIQIIVLNLLNLIFLFYIISAQPFVSIFNFIIAIVNELITEAAFLSALIIKVFDLLKNENYEQRNQYGWIIIYANLILLYWVVATGIIKPIYMVIYEFRQKRKKFSKVHCDK